MLWTEYKPVIKIGPKGALGSHKIRPIHSAPSLGQSIPTFCILTRQYSNTTFFWGIYSFMINGRHDTLSIDTTFGIGFFQHWEDSVVDGARGRVTIAAGVSLSPRVFQCLRRTRPNSSPHWKKTVGHVRGSPSITSSYVPQPNGPFRRFESRFSIKY